MTDENTVTQADREDDFAFIAAIVECAVAHGQVILKADTAKDMLAAAHRLSTQQEAKAVEGDVEGAMPVARAHVRLEDDGLFADLEVLNGERMQPEHSPVDLYLAPSQDKTAGLLREVEKQIAHTLETERLAHKQVELRGDLAAAENAVAEVRRSHKLFFRWAADHFMSRIDDHLSQGESA